MLTCNEVTDRASRKIDGDLSLRERIGVRVHLMMCVKCRSYYRQFRALVSTLTGGIQPNQDPPSPEFVNRVMTDIDAARQESPVQSDAESPRRP